MKLFTKLLLIFAFALIGASSVRAVPVTVSSFTNSYWRYGGTSAKIRAYLSERIVTSDNKTLLPAQIGLGNWVEKDCTVTGTNLVCPSFTIDSTTDSNRTNAFFTIVLFDEKGTQRETLGKFKIPPITPTTIADLILFNTTETRPAKFALQFYDSNTIDLKLAQLVGASARATDSIIGSTRLTAPALDSTDPIAVGANDPVYRSLRQSKYLKDYTNLAAAMTAIGATETDFVVDSSVSLTGTVTIPANIHVRTAGDAMFSTTGTLTINSLDADCDCKIFNSDGIVLGKSVKPRLVWWSGSAANVGAALNRAIASLTASEGGTLILPNGTRTIDAAISPLPSGTIIEGASTNTDAARGSILTTASGIGYVFKIGGSTRNVAIKNVVLDGISAAGSTGLLIEGAAPNTTIGISIDSVTFHDFDNGLYVNATDGAWQVEQLEVRNAQFVNNTYGFRINTPNASSYFTSPYFGMAANQTGMRIEQTGMLTVVGHNAVSSLGSLPCVSGLPNTTLPTFIHLLGQHLPITIIGGQDEALGKFLVSDVPYVTHSVNLQNNLVQSPILLKYSTLINSQGNTYLRNEFYDDAADAGALSKIYSHNDTIIGQNMCGAAGTAYLSGFTTHGVVMEETRTELFQSYNRQYNNFFLSPLVNGQTVPAVSIGAPENDHALLWLGVTDAGGATRSAGFTFKRNGTTGNLNLTSDLSNQTFEFINGEIKGKNLIGTTYLEVPAANITTALTAQSASVTGALTAAGLVSTGATYADGGARIGGDGGAVIMKIAHGGATLDPPAISGGTAADVTFTLTGAAIGDDVQITPSSVPAGIVFQSYVSAVNTVTVRFYNATGSSVDMASATWYYTWIKY